VPRPSSLVNPQWPPPMQLLATQCNMCTSAALGYEVVPPHEWDNMCSAAHGIKQLHAWTGGAASYSCGLTCMLFASFEAPISPKTQDTGRSMCMLRRARAAILFPAAHYNLLLRAHVIPHTCQRMCVRHGVQAGCQLRGTHCCLEAAQRSRCHQQHYEALVVGSANAAASPWSYILVAPQAHSTRGHFCMPIFNSLQDMTSGTCN